MQVHLLGRQTRYPIVYFRSGSAEMKLLPSEKLELSILEFTHIDGTEQWRATTLPALALSVNSQDWNAVSDSLVRLHDRRVLSIRKWMQVGGFVVAENAEKITEFLNHGEFQVNITPSGRLYTETLQQRANYEKSLSEVFSYGIAAGMLKGPITLGEEMRKALERPTVFEQHAIDLAKQWQTSMISPLAMEVALSKIDLAESTLYKNLVENLKITDLQFQNISALAVNPSLQSLSNIGIDLARQFEASSKAFKELSVQLPIEGISQRLLDQSAIIANLSVKLPDLTKLYWSDKLMLERISLVEDSVWNAKALEVLREDMLLPVAPIVAERISNIQAATQFVEGHMQLIRSLPPAIPVDEEDLLENLESRREEIGTKLEHELERMGSLYVDLRRIAWSNFRSNNVAGARVAMAGMRELYSEVLRTLAADDEVMKTDIWLKRKPGKETRPTRKMRYQFIVGDRLAEFDALVQFEKSVDNANKFTHTFSDDPEIVRVSIAQIENCLYLLLRFAKRVK
jgi:Predicted pPIWI-associating nuclease